LGFGHTNASVGEFTLVGGSAMMIKWLIEDKGRGRATEKEVWSQRLLKM